MIQSSSSSKGRRCCLWMMSMYLLSSDNSALLEYMQNKGIGLYASPVVTKSLCIRTWRRTWQFSSRPRRASTAALSPCCWCLPQKSRRRLHSSIRITNRRKTVDINIVWILFRKYYFCYKHILFIIPAVHTPAWRTRTSWTVPSSPSCDATLSECNARKNTKRQIYLVVGTR